MLDPLDSPGVRLVATECEALLVCALEPLWARLCGMSDLSEAVASHMLDCGVGARVQDGNVLRLSPRNAWVGVLVFGSWGVVVAVPLTIFMFTGELPLRSLPGVLGIAAVGYGLIYAAVRSVVNRARLERDGAELCFSCGPLWPHRARRWRLADVRGAEMTLRSPSFWHPARHRGYSMPQPYLIEVRLADGGRSRLPVTLGSADARVLTQFIEASR